MGILSGHLYLFGTQIWPSLGGSKFFALPQWFRFLLLPIQYLSSGKRGGRNLGLHHWSASSLLSLARGRSSKGKKLTSRSSELNLSSSVSDNSSGKKKKGRGSQLPGNEEGQQPEIKRKKSPPPVTGTGLRGRTKTKD
jgi:hypothetical protein